MDSSPLAALQPRDVPLPWARRDIFRSIARPSSGSSSTFSSGSSSTTAFRSLRQQLQSSQAIASERYGLAKQRNDSPATNLAAEISNSFHLDAANDNAINVDRNAITSTPGKTSFAPPSLPNTPGFDFTATPPQFTVFSRQSSNLTPLTYGQVLSAELLDTPTPIPPFVETDSPQPPQLQQLQQTQPLHFAQAQLHQDQYAQTSSTTSMSDAEDQDDICDDYEMTMDSPEQPLPPPGVEVPRSTYFVDRPRAMPRRTSLQRIRSFGSTSSFVHSRSNSRNFDSPLASFCFGESRLSRMGSNSSLSSETSDAGSVSGDKRPLSSSSNSSINGSAAPAVLGAPFRPRLAGFIGNSRTASPINGHVRRTSNPIMRTRKQLRRSLSMFETPDDIMKSGMVASPALGTGATSVLDDIIDHKADDNVSDVTMEMTTTAVTTEATAASSVDNIDATTPSLPHFYLDEPGDNIPRISKETLVNVLDGSLGKQFDDRLIIDCRFEYEYEGGHIETAVNYNDKEMLATQLFEAHRAPGRTLLVFHCEYSAHRAPMMARHIRSQDRTLNAENYPHLTYPEVYILDGGYSSFFENHRSRCYPQNYVEMSDSQHQRTCERKLDRLKNRRAPLCRAKTYAYGASQGPSLEDSPLAAVTSNNNGNRPRPSFMKSFNMLEDSPLANVSRRFASY